MSSRADHPTSIDKKEHSGMTFETARSASSSPAINDLYTRFRRGDLDRRAFLQRATAAGVSAAAAAFLANGGNVFAAQTPADGSTPAASPGASPAASPAATSAYQRPAFGTENQTRGQGDQLRILWWQAPTVLAPHAAGDSASNMVFEPLLQYFPDGSIQPVLLEATPTQDNGLLAADLSTVTLKLRSGIVWSDGEPVTAKDIAFTWQWIVEPANTSTSYDVWSRISNVEVVDDLTAVAHYDQPLVNWFDAFTGNTLGVIYPAHVFNNDPKNRNDPFLTNPIGTGPYKVESFTPNDQGTFVINENYREPNKPFFSGVLFKGGGDAISAGRAVVQTGEFDFAWNVQAEPAVLKDLEENGTAGRIVETRGATLEVLYLNFSDPNTEVDGQRSQKDTPHPFLTDLAVRQAINLAVQRDLIAREFYGSEDLATANILSGSDFFESPNTSWEYNLDKANQILDDAGWVLNGSVREKDGVQLALTFAASVNSVRQKTQEVIKQDLEKIGFKVDLVQADSTIFFDSSAGNDQNLQHFYWDSAIWSADISSLIPVARLSVWYAGPNGENISQKENDWQKANVQRFASADYDALYDSLLKVTTNEDAQKILIQMNDYLIDNVVVVPILVRAFFTAIGNRLRYENLDFEHPFVGYFWNLANWNAADGQ